MMSQILLGQKVSYYYFILLLYPTCGHFDNVTFSCLKGLCLTVILIAVAPADFLTRPRSLTFQSKPEP